MSYRFRGVSGGWFGECAGSLHASFFIIPVGNLTGRWPQVEVIQGVAETLEVSLSFKGSLLETEVNVAKLATWTNTHPKTCS